MWKECFQQFIVIQAYKKNDFIQAVEKSILGKIAKFANQSKPKQMSNICQITQHKPPESQKLCAKMLLPANET